MATKTDPGEQLGGARPASRLVDPGIDQPPGLALASGGSDAIALLPDARHVLAVPAALLTNALSPLYGRAPDAKLPSV